MSLTSRKSRLLNIRLTWIQLISYAGRIWKCKYLTIDDMPTISFNKPALSSGRGQITIVFQKEGLSLGSHTLAIQNGHPDRSVAFDTITILLDAITYTYDVNLSLSHSTDHQSCTLGPTILLIPRIARPSRSLFLQLPAHQQLQVNSPSLIRLRRP